MFTSRNEPNLWWQVVIEDPDFLAGRSVAEFLSFLLTIHPATDVRVTGIEWHLDPERAEMGAAATSMTTSVGHVLRILSCTVQVVWAYMSFFDGGVPQDCGLGADFGAVVPHSSFSVVCADNTYMYIYTPSRELVEQIWDAYRVVEVRRSLPDRLEYPY